MTETMKNLRLLGLARCVLVIAVPFLASACTKKASQTKPPPANSAPAGATNAGGGPSAEGGALPAGIDLGKLDAGKRKLFDEVVGREPSACGKGHSLLHSVKHDRSCRASFYAVRYVARLAAAGLSESEIGEKLQQRFREPRVPYIDVSQAPSKGSPSGRVKIVEFADYQCGHCKEAQAMMHRLLAEYPKDVTLYFKHFPLGGHIASLNGALGAAAAQKHGKFWEFSDKVWENSEHLTPAVLESIAKEIGLDFSRWLEDVGSAEVRSHVQRDRDEARSLEIRRTPGIFVNGRRYSDEFDLPSMKDWVDEELGR
jgi:protein-disulfide isomerase